MTKALGISEGEPVVGHLRMLNCTSNKVGLGYRLKHNRSHIIVSETSFKKYSYLPSLAVPIGRNHLSCI